VKTYGDSRTSALDGSPPDLNHGFDAAFANLLWLLVPFAADDNTTTQLRRLETCSARAAASDRLSKRKKTTVYKQFTGNDAQLAKVDHDHGLT